MLKADCRKLKKNMDTEKFLQYVQAENKVEPKI